MENIIKEIEKVITPVYLVGGCLRDYLLKQMPHDFDCACPLLPDEIENAIRKAGRKPYLVGKRFGTIGFKVGTETGYEYVEVTTFRNEQYKEGSRKPEVSFVKDITADLSRRDFTINALALRDGNLIDPFNGQEDLKNGIIKAVGQPSHRFKEDPLRMLRACRFSSQLNFIIEEKTFEAIKQLNYKILEVSKERWMIELDKLLMTDIPSIGLSCLMESRLLNFMIPELALQYNYNQNSPYHTLELWEHTKKVVDNVPKDIDLRLAALFHDIGKITVCYINNKNYCNYIKHELMSGEIVLKYASYLKWSNQRRDTIYDLVVNHMKEDSPLRSADNLGGKTIEDNTLVD